MKKLSPPFFFSISVVGGDVEWRYMVYIALVSEKTGIHIIGAAFSRTAVLFWGQTCSNSVKFVPKAGV